MHKTVEKFITGEIAELCAETKASLPYIQPFRDGFKAGTAFAELELAFKEDWTLCHWMDPYVWVRFKLDALLFANGVLKVVDWKSGALKADSSSQYQNQLELYTLALLEALRQEPKWAGSFGKDVKVTSELWFLDHQKPVPSAGGPVGEAERSALRAKWQERVGRMLSDTIHAPTPSFKCKWCPFRKGVGPCKFGG